METKFVILIILVLSILSVALVPRMKRASGLSMTERAYKTVHWIGAVCGFSGIGITIMFQSTILDEHLFELVLLPVLAAYAIYPAIVARVQKTDELLDEKQMWDTTHAAALSLAATTMTMFVVFAFYREGALTGAIWFPFLMFSVVGWYSAGTLYLHRTS